MQKSLIPALATGLVVAFACSIPSPLPEAQISATPKLQRLEDDPALHQLIQLSPNIYSGAAPVGPESFALLADMGIRTLVCVDSARPDVEGAAAFGLRYLHIPIGYDLIPREAELAIAAALEEGDGPYFFHCHHGKHRGPAAAAIALRTDSNCPASVALDVLELAGTSTNYPGLWRDVEQWTPPTADEARPKLVAIAEVSDFEGAMAATDRTWDTLKWVRDADWGVPPDHPDIDPKHEAKLLVEGLEACLKNPPAELLTNGDFEERMEAAVGHARALRDGVLEALDPAVLEERFQAVSRSCKDCHRDYRDS